MLALLISKLQAVLCRGPRIVHEYLVFFKRKYIQLWLRPSGVMFGAKNQVTFGNQLFDSMVQKVAESVDMHRCIQEGLTWVFRPCGCKSGISTS